MNVAIDDTQTVHRQLKEQLLRKIRSVAINTRLPSERALAEEFAVCRATVNKVMDELEQEGYISRRVGKGTFVVPRDNAVLKDTVSGRAQGEVIIAYPDFFSYWIWDLVHHAEISAMRHNLNLLNLKFQPESDFEALLRIAETQPGLRGIMILPPGDDVPKSLLKKLDSLPIPTVILGPLEQARLYRHVYEVRNDHYKSGYIKMECLLRLGHRNIGIVPNEPPTLAGSEHIRGVKQAVYDYGLRWKDLTFPDTVTHPWEDSMQTGYIQTNEVLDKNSGLTAILCDTITGAFGVLRSMYERNLRCPDDLSLVTAHSNFNIEEFSCPKLTTVTASATDNVAAAMDIILNPGTVHSKSILVDMKLYERESVKQINGEL